MQPKLPDGFRFAELSNEEFQKYWEEFGPGIFDDGSTVLDTRMILSEEEKLRIRELNQNAPKPVVLNLGIFKDEIFCGWFSGYQYNWETFYMRNSAILPEFRRQGLYTALMQEVLKRANDLGYQIVLSRHTSTNNAIIIPKLKAGFIITAFELSDRFGALVHLTYFFNATRRRVMEFRSGDLKPDEQIKGAIGIS